MTTSSATCDLNKILAAEETLLVKAICADAPPCEIKVLAGDIKELGFDIGILRYDVCHFGTGGIPTGIAEGNVLGDLANLYADSVIAGVNPICAGIQVACIGFAVSDLTGVPV
jgi:hypothetical protein